jgi:hypothetical protein
MFDTLFRSIGIKVIHLPHRAPNSKAFVERWIEQFEGNAWVPTAGLPIYVSLYGRDALTAS